MKMRVTGGVVGEGREKEGLENGVDENRNGGLVVKNWLGVEWDFGKRPSDRAWGLVEIFGWMEWMWILNTGICKGEGFVVAQEIWTCFWRWVKWRPSEIEEKTFVGGVNRQR
jgi:hypothetical protein